MSDFKVYNDLSRIMPPPGLPKPAMPGPTAEPVEDKFGKVLRDAIDQVNHLESNSQTELQRYMTQESDLHTVMLALEKADLSFQLMMQVRNKVVQAYQEIMRTQV